MMNAIYPLLLAATSGVCAVTSGAQAQNAVLSEQNYWLLGDFTQNAPYKVDRSNPVELKVRISTDQIESKSGVCDRPARRAGGDRTLRGISRLR